MKEKMGSEHAISNPWQRPLAVVISALIRKGKILLIKRGRGDYVGLWGLPGGKVERGEHLAEAAVREILEESGIRADFKDYLGIVSEHLVEGGRVSRHFLLHVFELNPRTKTIVEDTEGKLDWFDLDRIGEMESEIIPSDFAIIERMIRKREKSYYRCVLEKSGNTHTLKEFT